MVILFVTKIFLCNYPHAIVLSESQGEVLFVEERFYGVEVARPLVGDVLCRR